MSLYYGRRLFVVKRVVVIARFTVHDADDSANYDYPPTLITLLNRSTLSTN